MLKDADSTAWKEIKIAVIKQQSTIVGLLCSKMYEIPLLDEAHSAVPEHPVTNHIHRLQAARHFHSTANKGHNLYKSSAFAATVNCTYLTV